MNDALYIAATGMHMHQRNVESIANNLANVGTPGYKKAHVSFADLVYRSADIALPAQALQSYAPIGNGVSIAGILREFTAGELKKTDRPMDFAIQGDGFIELTTEGGGPAYTRAGTFGVDREGYLTAAGGMLIKPSIHVGLDAGALSIDAEGRVYTRGRSGDQMVEAGRMELVRFPDTSGLEALGQGAFRTTERSGEPVLGRAGQDGLGTLLQGYQEASNVNLTEEMVDLMSAQRAYESSVKVMQAMDEMLAMSNNLRK